MAIDFPIRQMHFEGLKKEANLSQVLDTWKPSSNVSWFASSVCTCCMMAARYSLDCSWSTLFCLCSLSHSLQKVAILSSGPWPPLVLCMASHALAVTALDSAVLNVRTLLNKYQKQDSFPCLVWRCLVWRTAWEGEGLFCRCAAKFSLRMTFYILEGSCTLHSLTLIKHLCHCQVTEVCFPHLHENPRGQSCRIKAWPEKACLSAFVD